MIDIHTHILPGIDDGAENIYMAQEMLAMLRDSGVDQIFLTPHFNPEKASVESFLDRRANAWAALKAILSEQEAAQIRLGAEVHCCPRLLSLNLKEVTLGNSDYLLLELPARGYPAHLIQFVEELLGNGIIPILAHVERYGYFRESSELLKELIDLGALAQVSAAVLSGRKDKNFAAACLAHNLAQIVASDAHNVTARRPRMELVKRLPGETRRLHEVFSHAVWDNELPPYVRTSVVKKGVFGYR